MNTRPQSMLSRWSVATAVFGGACNLLFVILTLYHDDSLKHIRPNDWGVLILSVAITLAPSLVLLVFRRYLPVTVIYASVLFSMLVWRIEYPHQYYVGRKFDDP